MCGIFGFYLSRKLIDSDIKYGEKALKELNHRGPDDSGFWFDKEKGIFLGHNRLSIIDTSKKNSQPMKYNDTIISYNGEIYNYLDIKRKFKNDFANFETNGDTEVLLKLWNLKGINSFDELDGMFAFAVFQKHSLFLSVDFFGEKPLFYSISKDGIYFSSEANPLIKLLNLKLINDLKNNLEFSVFGYINSPNTGYENLYKVEPSTYIKASIKNSKICISKEKYWKPNERIFEKGKIRPFSSKDIKSIKEILIDSISTRMISDVPLGLFLSSGIDSSLIACLIKKELNRNIEAFTVKFDKNLVHDESEIAKKIAEHIGINHKILFNPKIENYDIDKMKKLYSGDLNDNTTIFSVNEMSLLAKKSIKVALSGLGGDEIFLGYNRYIFYYKYLKWIIFLRKIKPFIRILNKITFNKIFKLNSLYQSFILPSKKSFYLNYKNLNQLQIMDQDLINEISEIYFSGDLNFFLNEASNYDLRYTMPNSYIPAIELGSMKASIEIRSPFLNKKLYDYITNNIDQRSLIHFGQKKILKSIIKDYLPNKYFDLPKKGFVFPINNLIGDQFIDPIHSKIILRDKLFKSFQK